MRRTSRRASVALSLGVLVCGLLLWSQAVCGQGATQGGDLTVALSSLSTETLDPALGGHIVKY